MSRKQPPKSVGFSPARRSTPQALLLAFHRSARDRGVRDLVQVHRLALLDWPVDEIEMRLIAYLTTSLTIGRGRTREPLLFRAGRDALEAYGNALARPDRERFQAMVGAGISTLVSALTGLQIEAAGGQRWTPTGGTPLSVWLGKLSPVGRLRVIRDLEHADTELLTAQIVRQCIPPALRKAVLPP